MQVSDFGGQKYNRQSPSRNVNLSEPMSPGSPHTQNMNSSNRQFLPGFLMGDLRSSPQNVYCSPLLKSPNQVANNSHQIKITQPRLSGLKSPTFERGRRHASPPTQSLWASANQRKHFESENMSVENGGSFRANLNSSINHNTPIRREVTGLKYSTPFQSPMHTHPLDTSCRDDDDEASTWVTVFGYDQAHTNFILQHFSHIGTIEKYVITNGGNWMNIKYANKIQARCALNRNGRVLEGKIMIGVRKCTDVSALNGTEAVTTATQDFMTDGSHSCDSQDVLASSANKNGLFSKPNEAFSPSPRIGLRQEAIKPKLSDDSNQSFTARGDTVGGPIKSCLSRHSSMRPLAAPYQPPPRLQVTRANQFSTFKSGNSKSSGLISKALDYVFGWN